MLTDAAGRGRRHVLVRQNHCSELNLQVLYFLYDDVNVRAGLSEPRGRASRGIARDKKTTIMERICPLIDDK